MDGELLFDTQENWISLTSYAIKQGLKVVIWWFRVPFFVDIIQSISAIS